MTLVDEVPAPFVAKMKTAFWRARTRLRHFLCSVVSGGHELYPAFEDSWMGQQCLLCGKKTTGWTIDRRDRRLHLVSNSGRRTGLR